MNNILLEAGTGEVEVVEFLVNNQHYAINVLKVKGIVQINEVTPLPKSPEEVAGIANVRGEMNTVIDLKYVLSRSKTVDYSKTLGLLCEFNDSIVVFLVDHVAGIRRIKWEDIKQNSQVQQDTLSIGSVLVDETIIVLLDFESITLAAQIGRGYEKQQNLVREGQHTSSDKYIVLAEDSRAIGEMLKCALTEAGYRHVKLFSNGQEAKDYIIDLKDKYGENFSEHIDLLITDIEMPVLDGYSLTRWVKSDAVIRKLPVVIFSSLISQELQHKGQEVGADVQIGKPSMKELVEVVERLIG